MWDQVNDSHAPNLEQNITDSSPIGQWFVPDLDYLEVVQLWVRDGDPTDHALPPRTRERSPGGTGPLPHR